MHEYCSLRYDIKRVPKCTRQKLARSSVTAETVRDADIGAHSL